LRALLLAAGLGTRLRPRTLTVPKCLVQIGGKPLLDYWLEHLFSAGIERALINTHWRADAVRDHVGKSPFRDRIDLVHETTLLGTGGTVLANREWYGEKPILVAHADNLTSFDVAHFVASHRKRPQACGLSMLAFHTDAPETCGILEVRSDGVVVGFHEKVKDPPGCLANGAVYILEPEVTAFIRSLERSVVDLSTEVIPHFMGRIFAVEAMGYHRDIGTEESLRLAELECSQGQLNKFN
jgi:mannose-1-phosphate guanylyltransferase